MKSFKFFLYLFFLFLANNSYLFARNKITIKTTFQTKLTAPTLIEYCDSYLWAYSIINHKIYKIMPKSGKIITERKLIELGQGSKVNSLGCYKNTLLFSSTQKPPAAKEVTILYKLEKGLKVQKISLLPGSEHIRDISCFEDKCLFMSDKIYISNDFKTYTDFILPPGDKIERIFTNKDVNPFSGWQDKHILAKSQYSKAIILKSGDLFLLDPQRTNVITYKDFIKSNNKIKAENFKKWGDWGTWEENLMYPKAIGYVEKFNAIAVSDTGLKMLFLFTPDGKYLGKIGMTSGDDKFSYPIDIATTDNTIYISDFKQNLLIGIEILSLGDEYKKTAETIDDLLRKDLFKNSFVIESFNETRCLHCHDGLLKNNLDKFANINNFHHPINRSLKGNVFIPDMKSFDLPLWNNWVSCSTCHRPHHDSIVQPIGKEEGKIPYFLRKNYIDLCTTCHLDKMSSDKNHINLARLENGRITSEVSSCTDCHVMHNSQKNLTTLGDPQLCFSCHDKKTTPIIHPFGSQKLNGETHDISCFSCHAIHGTLRQTKYAKHSKEGISSTCISCHKDLTEHIGKNKHLSPKKDLNLKNPWPGKESVCIDCHTPHKNIPTVHAKCLRCHEDKNHVHKKQIPIIATKRAEGIHLENKQITCTTCHDQHGLTKNKSFLKDRKTLLNFCTSCHDEDTSNLFDNYHERFERKKKLSQKRGQK